MSWYTPPEPRSSASPPLSANRRSVPTLLGRASGNEWIPVAEDRNRDIGAFLTLMRYADNQDHPAVPSRAARRRQRTRRHQSPLIVDGSIRRRDAGGTNSNSSTGITNSMYIGDHPTLNFRAMSLSRRSSDLSIDHFDFGNDTRSAHEIHMNRDDPNFFRSYVRGMIDRDEHIHARHPDSPPEDSELDSDEQLEQATSQYIYTRPCFTEFAIDLSIEVATVNHRLSEVGHGPIAHLRVFLEVFTEEGVRGATTIRGPRHPEFPHQTRLHFMFDQIRQRFAETGRGLVDVANAVASTQELDGLRFFTELERNALGAALDYYTTGSSDLSNRAHGREARMAADRIRTEYTRSSGELRRLRRLYHERVRAEVGQGASSGPSAAAPGPSREPSESGQLTGQAPEGEPTQTSPGQL